MSGGFPPAIWVVSCALMSRVELYWISTPCSSAHGWIIARNDSCSASA